MLSVKSYDLSFVRQCRARVAAALAAAPDNSLVLNEIIVALDASFVHRMRGQEGKDGNPLNEVRLLANAIIANGATLAADSTIKYDPAKSVSGIAVGDVIAPDKAMVERLADAVFAEIERRFG
jgi:hypothetical protein